MPDAKHACLVYVSATERLRGLVRSRLQAMGYSVCEVRAELDHALAAQAGSADLPVELVDCLTNSDLCIFLLPEVATADGLIGIAAGLAGGLDKLMVCVVAGNRADYPQSVDDHAQAVVREGSDRLDDAICGTEIREAPDRSPAPDRKIDHIRCQ
jgi:hypothetical protein